MKIYIQTETHHPDTAVAEPRPRLMLLETGAEGEVVRGALEGITGRLGAIAAIPPAAHELNLKHLVVRDLAEHGVLPGGAGEGDTGEAVLKVLRTPKNDAPTAQGEVYDLRYEVVLR